MKRFDNIEQGSIEWHQLRWAKIGGTLSKGLFVKSDTLLIDILSQRIEEFEPEEGFTSSAMDRGNDLEPFAREYLNNYTGLLFEKTGWIQSDENELLGISPDGLTTCNTIACEIKCFGRKNHLSVLLSDDVPLDNINQILHYFTVNPLLQELHWIAFRPESTKHFIKVFTLETLVNIGTKAKPKMLTIEAARDYSIEFANELLAEILIKEEQLKF